MTTYHHHHEGMLSVQQLAQFDAALGDLPEPEKKRRRVIYLKDALSKMKLGMSILKKLGCFMIPMVIIPVFWPPLIILWFVRKKARAMMARQLETALDYWSIGRHELFSQGPAQAEFQGRREWE